MSFFHDNLARQAAFDEKWHAPSRLKIRAITNLRTGLAVGNHAGRPQHEWLSKPIPTKLAWRWIFKEWLHYRRR